MVINKKTITILATAFTTVTILAVPVYAAWSSVTADALVGFSNFSNYYKVNITSKITASGSRASDEAIYHQMWVTLDGGSYLTDDAYEAKSPSELKWTSGKEGDPATWGVSNAGEIFIGGAPSGIKDRDSHSKTHPGM
ncbi:MULTISPECIES: hypothetical protein [Brevibacillus]|uniref:hypothetical protein n=1 Tax=Brevibacillus TaxID=55080 RepID=UPI0012F6458D|nr:MULTISPECIES: hypothetical protein [Brevibacillus]MED1826167.1 hypothetical protein [Brevibacillus agri]